MEDTKLPRLDTALPVINTARTNPSHLSATSECEKING